MQDRAKIIFGGAFVGFAAAGMLALPSILPPAYADDEPVRTMLKTGDEIFPEPLVASDFVKPDQFVTEPWVSTDVIETRTVRKIGYGRTTFVDITTTQTGTYSTDGLASPHFRYPGIHTNPAWEASHITVVALWDGNGWVTLTSEDADSIVAVVPLSGDCTEVGPTLYC